MTAKRKFVLTAIIASGAVLTATLILSVRRQPLTLMGAVLREDADPARQLPIPGVQISATPGPPGTASSDASGYFHLALPTAVRRRQTLTLRFRHPDYQSLDLTVIAGNQLYVARMSPLRQTPGATPNAPLHTIANVLARYTLKSTNAVSIGSAVKTIEVANAGNVRCDTQSPCSPDGKWKAAIVSASIDAGAGNEFRDPRISCLAGPCPFTRVDSLRLEENNRIVRVDVRDWSSTATFLLEAEVFRQMGENIIRHTYPVIFGRSMEFTLPAEAEGSSIEAEIDGTNIVFPLGPALCLRWGDCNARTDQGRTTIYRCELKPGYRFR